MYRLLHQALQRIRSDQRGNVFVLFGASAIPLLLVMGGAVDITRYMRYKAELSNAVDAAALALARRCSSNCPVDPKTFVTNHVASFALGDSEFTISSFDVTKLSNGFRVTADGEMKTIFLPLGAFVSNGHGLNEIGMNIVAEVVNSSNRLELALVFDNTGSMNCGNSTTGNCVGNWENPGTSSRIHALKTSAQSLVDTLMKDNPDNPDLIKIGIVPFEGAVNIGSTYAANPPAWVDWSDEAKSYWNGRNFDRLNFSSFATCTSGDSCASSYKRVGHKWLFSQLKQANSTISWAGCVEMRREPYDILDTTPTTSNADTLFVPFFWPDEPDRRHQSNSVAPYQYNDSTPNTQYNSNYKTGSNGSKPDADHNYTYSNNYLKDKTAPTASATRPAIAQNYVLKYRYQSSSNKATWHTSPSSSNQLTAATSFPYAAGPNYGCPRPIVPLTNNKTTIKNAISNLIAYYSSGTYIPVGLVWGWHLLTPNEPFTQGVAAGNEYYDKTVKAIVLFTDGENTVPGSSNHNNSAYSAYNYTNLRVSNAYRLGNDGSAGKAQDALDTKTKALCTNIKNDGPADRKIRLYTITFGTMTSDAKKLMEDCATVDKGLPLYYHAPTTSDLADVFRRIGEDLSDIHLAM